MSDDKDKQQARQKLHDDVMSILDKITVRDGNYEMIFTDGYMMIWKYIRDYAKAIGANPRNIKKGGRLDPIFTHMNNFMYPPKGKPALDRTEAADLIVAAADEHIERAEKMASGSRY